MRYLIGLLFLVSAYAQGAQLITSGVQMDAGNAPTVSYFSAPGGTGNQDLWAAGMRWFGVGTVITGLGPTSPNPGGPSPYDYPYGNLFGSNLGAVQLAPGDTWDAAIAKFLAKYPSSGSFTSWFALNRYYTYQACVMASKCDRCGGEVIPYPGSCSTIPWSRISCDITPSNIVLNHGTLQSTEVNGHIAKADMNISCTGNTNIRFRVTSSRINLGLGITSKIFINDTDMGGPYSEQVYSVQSWGLTVPVESRLQASNPQGGTFSGSTVVLVDVL